jgi:hypothetical protein
MDVDGAAAAAAWKAFVDASEIAPTLAAYSGLRSLCGLPLEHVTSPKRAHSRSALRACPRYELPAKMGGLEAFTALVRPGLRLRRPPPASPSHPPPPGQVGRAEASMPARVKETLRLLAKQMERRDRASGTPLSVVVSGAGCNVTRTTRGLSPRWS